MMLLLAEVDNICEGCRWQMSSLVVKVVVVIGGDCHQLWRSAWLTKVGIGVGGCRYIGGVGGG